jgi:hypothetical protein
MTDAKRAHLNTVRRRVPLYSGSYKLFIDFECHFYRSLKLPRLMNAHPHANQTNVIILFGASLVSRLPTRTNQRAQ